MSVNLPTKDHLEFLSLKGGCSGSLVSTHVKIPHCWKSHVTAHLLIDSFHKPERKDRHRGSNMSAHVLLNLLNKLEKEIKCEACRTFYLFFATSLMIQ